MLLTLILFHVALAAFHHDRRDYFPPKLVHNAHSAVVANTRNLQGYDPTDWDRSGPAHAFGDTFDGERGPEVRWTHLPSLTHEVLEGRLRGLWSSDEYRSANPFPFFLPALVHRLSGGSLAATALTPQIFLALAMLSVYGIVYHTHGTWAGLCAAAIAGGCPSGSDT